MTTPGTVYVLFNETMPGLVKIGRTRRSAEERARRLQTTAVARPFIVLWDEYVTHAAEVERLVHARLDAHREDRRREFFRVPPKMAIAALIEISEPYRLASPTSGQRVEVIDRLREQYGDILRGDLTSVLVLVTADAVLLRTSDVSAMGERRVVDLDLGFIYDEDEPWFPIDATAEVNAQRLMSLGAFSLIMTTDLVRPEAAERISATESENRQDRPPQQEKR